MAEELASGEEVGAAIAVDIDGEMVVDIWGGHADAAKTASGTSGHDRQPVVGVRGNGKGDIEFRHLLSHSAGVSGWELPFEPEDMYDGEVDGRARRAGAVVGARNRFRLPRRPTVTSSAKFSAA